MKSGDEIKKGLNDPIHVHYHIGDIEPRLTPLAFRDLEFLHADALAYIQQLEAQVPRWISVEERLPERGTWVLCCGAKGGLFLSDWLISYNINTNDNTVYCSVPNARSGRYAKYWMPLPEPPKEVTP